MIKLRLVSIYERGRADPQSRLASQNLIMIYLNLLSV